MTLLEYLQNVCDNLDRIDQIISCDADIIRLKDEDIRCARLIEKIQSLLCGNSHEYDFWDIAFDYIDANILTDSSIKYFIEHNIELVALSHMNLSDKWLIKLSNDFDEALLTISKRFYQDSNYSTQQFMALLIRFKEKADVFLTLLLLKNINHEKNKALIYYLSVYCSDKEQIREETLFYVLSYTDDITFIRECYKTNKYKLLLAISKNYFTPNDILEELLHIKDIKMAKAIRLSSAETLKCKNLTLNG